jgi:hypothetical protein
MRKPSDATEMKFFRPVPLPRWARERHGVRSMGDLGYRLRRPLEKPWSEFPVGTVLTDPLHPRLRTTNWLALLPREEVREVPRAVVRHLLQLNSAGFRAACRLFHLDPRGGYALRHLFRARQHLPGTTVMAQDFIAVQHGGRRTEGRKAVRVSFRRLRRNEFPALAEAYDDLKVIMPGSGVFRFRKYLLTRDAREGRNSTSPVLVVRSPRSSASHLKLVR